ncbi:MAG: dethiobiotin synthase [Lactococcus sp.]
MENYIICGIHTDSGKSILSVLMYQFLKEKTKKTPIIVKPIQTGHPVDTEFYLNMNINEQDIDNIYTFREAISPHLACKLEGKIIDYKFLLDSCKKLLKNQTRPIIFELAGGIYSPINDQKYMIDLMEDLSIPGILVINDYVGSINHALLTLEAIKQRQINIKGIIFNESQENSTCSNQVFKDIIKKTSFPKLGEVPFINNINDYLSNENNRKNIIKEWGRK